MTAEALRRLEGKLRKLSARQLALVETLSDALARPVSLEANPESDVVRGSFGEALGDVLRVHHAMSSEAFTKDKFEFQLVRVLNGIGRRAEKAGATNPGYDLTVDGERWSVKTEAASKIARETLHISKFMELGKGKWETEDDLRGLRDRMLKHMESYDRIFSLRCFRDQTTKNRGFTHEYELVEIPKKLLQLAATGEFEMVQASRQVPKPGYCRARQDGELLFELYFDGGTERKLQVKKLRKSRCVVHGTWGLT